MKVDMHFHLEEGPYSLRWLSRTLQGLAATEPGPDPALGHHTIEYAEEMKQLLSRRMEQGAYSEEWLDRYLIRGANAAFRSLASSIICTGSGNAARITRNICCWMTVGLASCSGPGWTKYAWHRSRIS